MLYFINSKLRVGAQARMNIKLKKQKPRISLSQGYTLVRLTSEHVSAAELGSCQQALLELVTKGLAELKTNPKNGTLTFCKKAK